MKAMALSSFGGPEVLECLEVDEPPVGPDVVLVSVRAAGVNPVDGHVRQGNLTRAYPHHFPLIPGWDVAGVVEQVGPGVSEFGPGDEVIGYVRRDEVQWGTYAERVPAPVRCLARKPVAVDFEQAAGLPLAGLTAWQAIEAVGVTGDDTVLVHAAAGGVGSFAVQLAAARGARVIGTASKRNHDYLRGLGAEPVSYGEGLAARVRARAPHGVDVALDFVGGDALEMSPALVHDPGRIVSVVDAAAVLEMGGRYVFVRPNAEHLSRLADLVDAGHLHIEVEDVLDLRSAGQAQQRCLERHTRGKLVLKV